LRARRKRAFGTLLDFVKECQAAGDLPGGDAMRWALLSWSVVHGAAKLAITGRLPFSSADEVLKFTEFVIDRSMPGAK
jgi:hypothetical protein